MYTDVRRSGGSVLKASSHGTLSGTLDSLSLSSRRREGESDTTIQKGVYSGSDVGLKGWAAPGRMFHKDTPFNPRERGQTRYMPRIGLPELLPIFTARRAITVDAYQAFSPNRSLVTMNYTCHTSLYTAGTRV